MAPDDIIDGGNIKLSDGPSGNSAASASIPEGSATTDASSSSSSASVLFLDPLLLSEAEVGALQTLAVTAFDKDSNVLAGREVTFEQTLANGTTKSLTTISGLDGLATVTITVLDGESEFIAYDGARASNAIDIAGLIGS